MATTSRKTRVERIETALSPLQAYLLELQEQQAFRSHADFVHAIVSGRLVGFRDRLFDRVEAGIRKAMTGRKSADVDRAVEKARLDMTFFATLVHNANQDIRQNVKVQALQAALLVEQIKGILEADAASNEVRRVSDFLTIQTAYPIDADTAAALEADRRYQVAFGDRALRPDGPRQALALGTCLLYTSDAADE